jgi:hypothetical protein
MIFDLGPLQINPVMKKHVYDFYSIASKAWPTVSGKPHTHFSQVAWLIPATGFYQ